MSRFFITFLLVFLPWYFYPQTNLVDNPSFEYISSSFPCGTSSDTYYWNATSDYWDYVGSWTVPHYKSPCVEGKQVGSSDCYCTGGHTGSNYGFTRYREYIVAQLLAPLQVGHRYYVEFYVKGNQTRHNSGVKFFMERPKQCSTNSLSINDGADVGIDNTAINNNTWTKISSYINATQAYTWIGLGSFNIGDRKEDGPTFSFDDISVIEVGYTNCNDINYIQNTYFQNIGEIQYKSEYLTIAGSNVASTLTSGPVVIGSNAIIELKSETQVVLEDGFSTEPGAIFEARIAPCDADCLSPTVNAGQDIAVCGTTPVQLGSPPEDFTAYSWSANPTSAIAHLSNTSIANPLFAPTAGVPGNGLITYTVTATNECGQSVSDVINVIYEPAPNNSPTVNVSNVMYSDMIEFDASFGSHTEQLFIEVTTSSGTPVATYTYHLGSDFTCCNYHWKIPVALSPCNDYKIKIYTKNLCSNVLSSPVILNWVRNHNVGFTYVSNVITNNSPNWCFGFTGAVQYELVINGAWGTVYTGSGTITPPQACIWSGQCNQQCTGSTVKDGTYFYILKIKGCDGTSITQTGFITVLINANREATVDESDTTTTTVMDTATFAVEAFPNPSSGIVNLQINGLQNSSSKNKVQVYNSLGSVIYTTETSSRQLEIDLSTQAQGIYNIKVETEYGIKTTKIIYSK